MTVDKSALYGDIGYTGDDQSGASTSSNWTNTESDYGPGDTPGDANNADYSNEGRQYGGDPNITPLDPTVSGIWANIGTNSWLDSLKKLFSGTSDAKNLGALAGFGGLAALLQKLVGNQSAPVIGYQGGIPKYTVNRQQTPIAQQRPEGYRPGQGGITYFAPTTYSSTGTSIGSTPTGTSSAVYVPAATPTGAGSTTYVMEPGASAAADTAKTIMPVGSDRTIPAATGGYMPGIAGLAGGRFLRGPGDGVSDSIKARFDGSGEPARLADGEFVLDARTVSEIGNGSSEAGARKLYEMVDRIHKARKAAQRGKPSNADKSLPA